MYVCSRGPRPRRDFGNFWQHHGAKNAQNRWPGGQQSCFWRAALRVGGQTFRWPTYIYVVRIADGLVGSCEVGSEALGVHGDDFNMTRPVLFGALRCCCLEIRSLTDLTTSVQYLDRKVKGPVT